MDAISSLQCNAFFALDIFYNNRYAPRIRIRENIYGVSWGTLTGVQDIIPPGHNPPDIIPRTKSPLDIIPQGNDQADKIPPFKRIEMCIHKIALYKLVTLLLLLYYFELKQKNQTYS